ncbi:hypothetical protein H7F51_01705 [Novosphingobium flavum]|uniref:Nucleotidyl transferase AbiEii toxin, Type IV TA system n=1 Tax=Novosphingobium flavum TaxID=1778672 RepID=A0A7X1KK76_9SPHN|nr:hypothetical protein [Novosphingobium flavum]MBC2664227.1 hypothetical protein [Novosphingobium flavum]
MTFPTDYVALLEKLAVAFTYYEDEAGRAPLLVGGAATAILTAGAFMSGDFDVVAGNDEAFAHAMELAGFKADARPGRLQGGYYHPDFPEYGIELVSGPAFDGRSDRGRVLKPVFRGEHSLTLPAIEDLIADRLGQHAVASPSDDSRLRQAQMLLAMAKSIDLPYLERRVAEEGGDFGLLDLSVLTR